MRVEETVKSVYLFVYRSLERILRLNDEKNHASLLFCNDVLV